jgi:hypothetical protein
MVAAALDAGDIDLARALLAGAADDLPLTRVLAGRAALVGGDAATALAEADAVLARSIDVGTRLTALDIRARALDFLGDRSAAAAAWTDQAAQAAASGRTQAELRAVFQLGKQDFFDGGRPVRLTEAVRLARNAGALVAHPGGTGQQRGVLGRQEERLARLVILNDAAGGHRAEPFAHVTLGQPGPVGQLPAGRPSLRGRCEQAAAMADIHHRAEQAPAQYRHEAPTKRLLPWRCQTRLRS